MHQIVREGKGGKTKKGEGEGKGMEGRLPPLEFKSGYALAQVCDSAAQWQCAML